MQRRHLGWLALYAVAMACVEGAVVVYLRELYYPDGFSFPVKLAVESIGLIEVVREAATLVMLLSVAWLAGADRWERFLAFCIAFGIWDIFYYVWLKVFIGWPESLLTWDILFLIPLPWIGPVLAPVLVSVGLIGGSLRLLALKERRGGLSFSWTHWAMAVAGGALVLVSFMIDFQVVLKGLPAPQRFRWEIFGAGGLLGLLALGLGIRAQSGRR